MLLRPRCLCRAFDAVLVDAPCSSERHLLHDPQEMATWTPKRTKQNAKRQLDILLQAIFAARPGGRLLYSTCSISPVENDDVVEKLLKKRGEVVEVCAPTCAWRDCALAQRSLVLTHGSHHIS